MKAPTNERGDRIAAWLELIGEDRHWLAQRLGAASRHTVDKYFGPKGRVPERAWMQIQNLMGEAPDLARLELSLEDYEKLRKIAEEDALSIPDLIAKLIRQGLARETAVTASEKVPERRITSPTRKT